MFRVYDNNSNDGITEQEAARHVLCSYVIVAKHDNKNPWVGMVEEVSEGPKGSHLSHPNFSPSQPKNGVFRQRSKHVTHVLQDGRVTQIRKAWSRYKLMGSRQLKTVASYKRRSCNTSLTNMRKRQRVHNGTTISRYRGAT